MEEERGLVFEAAIIITGNITSFGTYRRYSGRGYEYSLITFPVYSNQNLYFIGNFLHLKKFAFLIDRLIDWLCHMSVGLRMIYQNISKTEPWCCKIQEPHLAKKKYRASMREFTLHHQKLSLCNGILYLQPCITSESLTCSMYTFYRASKF